MRGAAVVAVRDGEKIRRAEKTWSIIHLLRRWMAAFLPTAAACALLSTPDHSGLLMTLSGTTTLL